jgi:hypothetical protein
MVHNGERLLLPALLLVVVPGFYDHCIKGNSSNSDRDSSVMMIVTVLPVAFPEDTIN